MWICEDSLRASSHYSYSFSIISFTHQLQSSAFHISVFNPNLQLSFELRSPAGIFSFPHPTTKVSNLSETTKWFPDYFRENTQIFSNLSQIIQAGTISTSRASENGSVSNQISRTKRFRKPFLNYNDCKTNIKQSPYPYLETIHPRGCSGCSLAHFGHLCILIIRF